MLDLDLKLSASKQYLILISLVTLSCLGAVILVPMLMWIKILVMLGVIFYSGFIFLKYGFLQCSSSIKRLILHKNDWRIFYRDELIRVEVMGESLVTSWVTILRINIPGKFRKLSCVIFNDSLNKDEYRRLLVGLKC